MTRARKNLKAPRGTAATELSILMVALIPLVMYTLFLQDLLSYKLEAEEPVVTAPWDFAVYNFATPLKDKKNNETMLSTVQRSNRRTFCDHSAAYNTYKNPGVDCNGTEGKSHHYGATAAHQCWILSGAQQVTCGMDNKVGEAQVAFTLSGQSWYKQFNKGGMAHCMDRLGVVNSFLPHQIFTWSAKKADPNLAVSNKTMYNAKDTEQVLNQVHKVDSDTEDGEVAASVEVGEKDQWIMRNEKFGVLQDPWALNAGEFTKKPEDGKGDMLDIDPDSTNSNHPLYVRVDQYYGSAYGSVATGKALKFGTDLSTYLMFDAVMDGLGDNPMTPNLAWKPAAEREWNKHYASGWADSRVKDTNQARGKNYFSQKDSNYW